ncbi:DUF713 domain-containing protein [Caenorhabditis elegans]|uniref:Uncharacterized protein n=1 Tax=Caenorhabditis elegans TaxID=6239 RepID=A0A0K3AYE8_CAEEL|nr:Uncharacterized protein CELE_ZC196.3 [Caenorhabditis elegans]CTQ86993.1 Uncharacterized protein CELE_ZC196.3 [Caenorhabditis elegans]|eukprot:NP_001300294.1 Uncharacterized protein CELE_ZC196.3 [Caenorhabditis elegans]
MSSFFTFFKKSVPAVKINVEMIENFNKCDGEGNYKKFYKENLDFLMSLNTYLEKTSFDKGTLEISLCKNFIPLFDYLSSWNPESSEFEMIDTSSLEKYVPEVLEDLKYAIFSSNWTDFYFKYRSAVDTIIELSRKQGTVDISIQIGNNSCESFKDRDFRRYTYYKLGNISEKPENHDQNFERKLEQQEAINSKELEEMKKKRELKKKEFEAELEQIQSQMKNRFIALFECIRLKQRFEEKEEKVADWIQNCYKQPIKRFLEYFRDFQNVAREWKYFKRLPSESLQDAYEEISILSECVLSLFDTLEFLFIQLGEQHDIATDALFIKVLQKSIIDFALVLSSILNILDVNAPSHEWYKQLEKLFFMIKLSDIPTTTSLRKICKKAVVSNYEQLEFPKIHLKSYVVIHEQDNVQAEEVCTSESKCVIC